MSKTRKLFVTLVVIFVILLSYASYDISRRTTFPGSKPQLKERLHKAYLGKDSTKGDSLSGTRPEN
ncbi:MAG: hypothetical protein OEV74_05040 [Cyclobacteriaceae bacterium]|nr:hypothetical protein [Cyclobacteriaceae bacterium]MDH4295624.1 hypothetical protein [Cyclobacteriaceae bacterium]MDH5248972.1 hypothetical protein [Cyclobacteriaceae bacterium]